jgi:hypothetical protein
LYLFLIAPIHATYSTPHLQWFDHPNKWWRVQIMEYIFIHFLQIYVKFQLEVQVMTISI